MISCKWEKPMATAKNKYGEKVTFYGGGNVLAVVCFENKELENFIVDKKHFKDCEYNGTEYTEIVMNMDRGVECKRLMECFLIGGFDFKVEQRRKEK